MALLLVGLQTTDNLPLAVVLYVLAAALVPVFIWQERRAPEPLVPLWLFGRRAIGVSTLGGLLLGCALYGQSTFLPPFVQGVMGATPTISGFVLAGSSISLADRLDASAAACCCAGAFAARACSAA